MKHRPHGNYKAHLYIIVNGVDERLIKKIVGHKGQGVNPAGIYSF